VLLTVRIRVENAALRTLPSYDAGTVRA